MNFVILATVIVSVIVTALVLAVAESLNSIVSGILTIERDDRLLAMAKTRVRAGAEAGKQRLGTGVFGRFERLF